MSLAADLRPHDAVAAAPVPLYVDLDGTLIATDLLHESVLKFVKDAPLQLFRLPLWLSRGKAVLKRELADRVDIDVAGLPYRPEVIEHVREARAQGRRTVLATASDEKFAKAVAEHLGLFDGVIASDGVHNRSGERKLEAIRADAQGPFSYAGDGSVDLEVWRGAESAVAVTSSKRLLASIAGLTQLDVAVAPRPATLRDYLYGMRLHQWVKNILVALPLAPVLHAVTAQMLTAVALAFVCFGLMASSIYIVNDLLDLEPDRRHHRKKKRPFAAGVIGVPRALGMAAALCASSLLLASLLPWAFTGCLLFYAALTSAYSFSLKRRAVVDVCALAGLYTMRIIAGAAATGLPLSLWILSFSIFLFLSLALAKRYVEIAALPEAHQGMIEARGYMLSDRFFVLAAGLGAGQMAVLLLSLYINDPLIAQRYSEAERLWLIPPLLLFWILRIWLRASRRTLHDDPVVFAVRDRVSRLLGVAMLVIVWFSA